MTGTSGMRSYSRTGGNGVSAARIRTVVKTSDIVAVDLFCGIGALSLGLRRAGARVAMAVESDPVTASTYRANNSDVNLYEEEITAEWHLTPRVNELGLDTYVLVGGPPCKGWSTLGARSNKSRRDNFQSNTWDFARLVDETSPAAFLFENVVGLHGARRGTVLNELVEHLEGKGKYRVSQALLRSADYGVPQLRQRLFLVGLHRDLGTHYEFPEPSHRLQRWVTVSEAIDDLPALEAGDQALQYTQKPRTRYQSDLRDGSDALTWHEAPRAGETVQRVLKSLRPGQARADLDEDSKPPTGFHNTYGRMRGDAPASAVTGSIGRVSSGRYAHPKQDRAVTPREAARLQSLPDSYHLRGFRWEVYRQIGDAVPPLLAEKVAKPLVDALVAGLN